MHRETSSVSGFVLPCDACTAARSATSSTGAWAIFRIDESCGSTCALCALHAGAANGTCGSSTNYLTVLIILNFTCDTKLSILTVTLADFAAVWQVMPVGQFGDLITS